MKIKKLRSTVAVLAFVSAGIATCFGQAAGSVAGVPPQAEHAKPPAVAAAPSRFYRLDFVVKELENDKVINSRAYASTVAIGAAPSSLRSGSRIPISHGSSAGPQYQYYDLGVNIDYRDARELTSGLLTLTLNVSISSVVVTKDTNTLTPPVVRNTSWATPVILPVKKVTTVYSSDDPSGNRKMQLDLTATPIS